MSAESNIERIQEITRRVARDVTNFNALQEKFSQTKFPRTTEGFASRLDESSEIVTYGGFVLTTLVNLRFELLNLSSLTGMGEFKTQARSLAQDVNELIQNLRTVVSASVETNRSIRDRYAVCVDKEKSTISNIENR